MARLAQPKNEAEPAAPVSFVPVLTGTHFHALDEKGRVIIPAKLRPALTEHFWMMLNADDNIALYDYDTGLDILRHCEHMMAEHPENEDIAEAVLRITGAAEDVIVENGWRVQVPDILRYYAQLDKELVTVGALNHAILWPREKWIASQERREQSVEVRRAQAEMLRAAASSIRKPGQTTGAAAETAEVVETEQANVAATGTTGARGVAAVATGTDGAISRDDERTSAAPASDGKRGSRVLTLSGLGR